MAIWTEETSAALRSFVEGGEMSYARIAAAINSKFGTAYSRNASIGRAGRMGLLNPYKIKAAKTPRQHKPRIRLVRSNGNSNQQRVIEVSETALEKLRCVEVVPRNLSLLELEPSDCRYPSTDESPFLFCANPQFSYVTKNQFGEAVETKSSYCSAHFGLTRQAPRNVTEAERERRRRHMHTVNKQMAVA